MDITEVRGTRSAAPPQLRSTLQSRRGVRADSLYFWASLAVAGGLVLLLAMVVGVLLSTSWPAIEGLGWSFFTNSTWNTATNVYGALAFLTGTSITTGLALLIAVPLSLAIAMLLTDFAPSQAAAAIGLIIDVAAGVPTIVFGVWAVLTLVPWMRDTAEPAIQVVLGWIPLFSTPSIGYLTGQGMFVSGLVLAAMVSPTIIAVSRDSLRAVPHELREASLGLGATRWETASRVVLRQSRPAILGGIILACGRALGEAIAIVYIIGSVPKFPESLFDIGSTLSVLLLNEAGNTIPGTLNTGALYEVGLVLLALSLLTSVVGRMLTQRLLGAAGLAGGARDR
jgi:phosphate transport system permease protein